MSKQRRAYDKIKAFLVENGFKHRDVAKVIDTKPNTVSKKLNGFGDFTLEEAKKFIRKWAFPLHIF